jgi:hypothetical protein
VLVPVDGLETIPEIPDVTPDVQQPTGNLLAVGLAVLGLQPGQKLALVAKRPNVKVVDENTLSVRTIQYLQSIGVISDESLPTGGTQPSPAPIIAALADLMQPGGDTDGGLHLDEPPGAVEPLSGHTFELLEPLTDGVPVEVSAYQQETVSIPTKMWRLRSRTGAVGEARLPFFAVDTVPAAADGETIAEVRRIEAVYQGTGRMLLQLDTRLKYVYDRGSLVISANVAASTHGEAVRNEVLGNGDPASPNQTFTLKKPPLTYVPSPDTPSGGLSTLGVRVNNILWREVPALFGAPPDDQVYTLRRADDGKVDVIFGDGKQGSRLPSGVSNVVAGYRTGIGLEGQVSARSLTLLATRPLGVRSVVNPLAATGAAPPALIEDARQNAPLVVRTLDRVVSVADVQDFARAFAGVGKAQARLLWSGTTKLVHLTVGGADGLPIPEDSPVLTNLAEALLKNGDPSLIIQTPIDSFDLHRFRLTLQLEIDERFERFRVEDQVRAALLDAFSFANRQFGQPVNESEILRLAQDVQGVLAANVALLADENADDPNLVDQDADELIVQVAHFDEDLQRIVPGELLLINPDHLILEDLAT